jgi:AbiV family abortive infection protein
VTTYETPVEFIADGAEACWSNAVDLVESAKQMKEHGRNGLAVSLSVLALEEVGKLCLVDGLLFAKPGDERRGLYEKGFRSHAVKLKLLDAFPLMLDYLSTFDSRYLSESKFSLTLAIVVDQYKHDRMALAPWLGPDCDLVKLDRWKQKGFYVHVDERNLLARPAEIDEKMAAAVLQLAIRIVDAVNFVMKNNIGRYRERTKELRRKLTGDQEAEIRKQVQGMVEAFFSLEETESPDGNREQFAS